LEKILENIAEINLYFYASAYLLGSIPFGLILAKMFAGVDIKNSGSGNIGATNVLRVVKERDPKLAKRLSALTLLLDALKGAVVLLVAKSLEVPEATLWAIAVLAVAGHTFSIFLMFEGGKGVATGLGVSVIMLPLETLVAFIVYIFVSKALKISSISSLVALLTLFVSSFYISPEITHVPIGLITFFIFYKHIPNIERIIRGEEKRVI
jgi:glycerol-3-phosphate acyltransferase PlsY